MAYKTAATKTFLSCIAAVIIVVLVTVAIWDPATTFNAETLVLYSQSASDDIQAPGDSLSYSSKFKRSEDTALETNFEVPFDPHDNDTMVYVHVQKTGGSAFLEHMVTLQMAVFQKVGSELVKRAPLKLCKMSQFKWKRGGGFLRMNQSLDMHLEWCPRDVLNRTGETWFISEKTTGWMCGVHALYVDFVHCLRNVTEYNKKAKLKNNYPFVSTNRTFHYVTLLRHPVLRYLSEYLHTTRGACWPVHNRVCNGEIVKIKQPPLCANCRIKAIYANPRESLREYLDCEVMWRNNRFTLALADSELVTCWNRTQYTSEERGTLVLESAKQNLLKLAFFGILEFQEESGLLFERTFGVEFGIRPPHIPFNSSVANLLLQELPAHPSLYEKVIANNKLDLELYWFAVGEFKKRMRAIGKELDSGTLHDLRTLLSQTHNDIKS